MTASTKIRVTDLDYDSIRAALVDFFKQQTEFSDYNFDASGLSTIIDALAYNSHYQALLANFLANEMFIDTAVKRSSIVSRAKELGYVPQSAKAPKATITVEVRSLPLPTISWPSSLVIPSGTKFSTTVNNQSFTFVTTDSYSTSLIFEGGQPLYRFTEVDIYEGTFVQNTFTFNTADALITIPNYGVDVSTLRVWVQNTTNDQLTEYSRTANFLTLDGESKVFFYQEGFNGQYQISFGDGVIGVEPPNNAIVQAKYLVTGGPAANSASVFGLASSLGSETIGASFTIITTQQAGGGKDPEDIDGIKYNALNFFGTQNRAVITTDYAALISNSGVNVKSVIVWGGEDNDPPQFGKVFFCVQPLNGDVLTTSDKDAILAYIQQKAVANSRFEFVDPDYVDLSVESIVIYDKTLMNLSVFELETLVRFTIAQYTRDNLTRFGGVFRDSNLSNLIDSSNEAVLNNNRVIKLKKEVTPNLYIPQQISFSFFNPLNVSLKDPALTSTPFFVSGRSEKMYFEDSGSFSVNIIYYDSTNTKKVYQKDAGTLDYNTGKVVINPLTLSGYEGTAISITALPAQKDILSSKNVIVRLQDKNISVTARADY